MQKSTRGTLRELLKFPGSRIPPPPFPTFMTTGSRTLSMERITAVAKGRVQGVGYRCFVAECAHAAGVHGSVQNLPDGTVEIIAESSPAALDDFLHLAHAGNDPVIRVEEIAVKKGPATGEFRGFFVAW